MEVGNVKVMDNAQEIARIINSAGRPVAVESTQASQAAQLTTAQQAVKPAQQTADSQDATKKEAENQEQVKPTIEALNNFLEFMSADIRFQIHEKTQRVFVQLISEKDHRVLRQYPPKEFLDMVASIREFVGIFLDKKA